MVAGRVAHTKLHLSTSGLNGRVRNSSSHSGTKRDWKLRPSRNVSSAAMCSGAFRDCGGDSQRPLVMHWPRPMKLLLPPLFDPGGTKIPALHPEHSVHPSDRQTVSKASLPLPPSIHPSDHLNVRLHVITGGLGERSGEGPFSQLVWTRQRL